MPIFAKRRWLLTLPALLLLMVLLLRVVANTQLYSDETLVYHFTRFDLAYTVQFLGAEDVHPPLWFSLFWGWRHLVGDGEFAGRMLSLLFSLLTLAMSYRLGRDWFGKARFGLFAMLILGANAYFLSYALDIRPYALVMLLAAISMWLYARWLKREARRLAVAYAVVTAIMLYVHYFMAFLIIVQVICFLLRRPSRRLLAPGVGAGILAIVLWLPWAPSFVNQVLHLRQIAQEAGNAYGLGIGTPTTTQATNGETIAKLVQLATNGQPLLYGTALTLGLFMLWRKAQYRLALLWAFGVPALALTLNTAAAVYNERYVVYLTMGLALAVGAGLAALKRATLRLPALAVFVALNLWLAPALLPVRPPYRDLFAQVSALAKPGDVVLNTPAVRYDQFMQWEQGQYLATLLQQGVTTDVETAQSARRVWFLTGDWFDDGVRTQFEQLEPTHPVQQVFGQCDRAWCYLAQLMEAPPNASAQRFGADVDFWGIDVDSVTPTAVTTRLWWRVEQAPSLDYSISLRLVNSDGAVVAQNDGPINHYGTQMVQTSQLEPGKIYIDWRTLDLPTGLPSGQYTLQLVVYQSWDNVRLLLADGSDALTVYSLIIS